MSTLRRLLFDCGWDESELPQFGHGKSGCEIGGNNLHKLEGPTSMSNSVSKEFTFSLL